mgnify:CR=1 FL=1
MPSELHEQLCQKGLTWLKRNGFAVAAMNIWAVGSRERVDCIGYRQQCSAMIEVKVSRSDFLADRKKPERLAGGVGTYRFYLAPAGLIAVSDLPSGWGLLEFTGRSVQMVHGPKGNLWPSIESAAGSDWEFFVHRPCIVAERSILYTIARQSVGN